MYTIGSRGKGKNPSCSDKQPRSHKALHTGKGTPLCLGFPCLFHVSMLRISITGLAWQHLFESQNRAEERALSHSAKFKAFPQDKCKNCKGLGCCFLLPSLFQHPELQGTVSIYAHLMSSCCGDHAVHHTLFSVLSPSSVCVFSCSFYLIG